MRFASALMVFAALAFACGDDDGGTDAATPDVGDDVTTDVSGDVPIDVLPPHEIPWPHEFDSAADLGDRRGRRIARSIVHLHSPLSHDACDGEGWVDGELADPVCLQHLRDSLCALRIDAAMLTDHAPHVNEADFDQALWVAPGDEPIVEDGATVANRIVCPDGHRVLLTVGSENRLMPIGLRNHPGASTDPEDLNTIYDADDPDSIQAFRDAGGLIWIAHTEEKDVDYLRSTGVDGLELYNLHADVDPRSRSEWLGIEDPGGFVGTLLRFAQTRFALEPDLAVMTFLSRQGVSLGKWDTLLAEGRRVAGTGGCDAHENAFPMELTDGERADSYRRMMSWITNHVLVDDITPDAVKEGLEAGRLYVVHEVFGTPVGFDFVAEMDGTTYEMGDTTPAGATLRLTRPSLPDGFPNDPQPVLSLHILRSAAGEAVEVASGTEAELSFVTDAPGAYRAEVRMIPEHTRPYLRTQADDLIREQVWVYSNPIFVDLAEVEPVSLEIPLARHSPAWRRAVRAAERSIRRTPVRQTSERPR